MQTTSFKLKSAQRRQHPAARDTFISRVSYVEQSRFMIVMQTLFERINVNDVQTVARSSIECALRITRKRLKRNVSYISTSIQQTEQLAKFLPYLVECDDTIPYHGIYPFYVHQTIPPLENLRPFARLVSIQAVIFISCLFLALSINSGYAKFSSSTSAQPCLHVAIAIQFVLPFPLIYILVSHQRILHSQ